jgi:hypothetical protein
MSRKKAAKSNIGIFEGKEAEYNKQILKTLFTNGALTAWEIAKKICNHKYPNIYEHEARSRRVYSVIQRKTGRIQDLKGKGYIDTENNKWVIAPKGAMAILILEPALINKIHPDYLSPNQHFEPIKAKEVKLGPIKIETKFLNTIMKTVNIDSEKPQTALLFAKKTKELIDDGVINLDRISEDKLLILVSKMIADDGFYKKLFQA